MKNFFKRLFKNKSDVGDACVSILALSTTCIILIDKYKNN